MTTQSSDLAASAAWFGLDWADGKHDVCLQAADPPRLSTHAAQSSSAFIHRCWIDRQPYDESIYLKSLKKRGSPLLAFMLEQNATSQP